MHSLTHSIPINPFIKLRLNIFSCTSPAKYYFALKSSCADIWKVSGGSREELFCSVGLAVNSHAAIGVEGVMGNAFSFRPQRKYILMEFVNGKLIP